MCISEIPISEMHISQIKDRGFAQCLPRNLFILRPKYKKSGKIAQPRSKIFDTLSTHVNIFLFRDVRFYR